MPITRTLAKYAALLAVLAGVFALAGPVTAQAPVSECNDGADNDGDGATDAIDNNCKLESGSAYGDIVNQTAVAIPTITLQGTVSRKGVVDVSRLQILGGRGTVIRITCLGKTCPTKRLRTELIGSTSTNIKRFQGKLRPPMVITMRAGLPGLLGKHTTYRIKKGEPPVRKDTCYDGQDIDKVIGCYRR